MPVPLIVLGRVGRPHGVTGLLHIDRPGDNLREFTGKEVHLCKAHGNSAILDETSVVKSIVLTRCEPAKGEVTRIQFANLRDRDEAANLTNLLVAVPQSDLSAIAAAKRKSPPQGLHDLWFFEIMGLTVVDAESQIPFARITHIEDLGHNTLIALEPLPNQSLLQRRLDIPLEYPHWENADLNARSIKLSEWKAFAEA